MTMKEFIIYGMNACGVADKYGRQDVYIKDYMRSFLNTEDDGIGIRTSEFIRIKSYIEEV